MDMAEGVFDEFFGKPDNLTKDAKARLNAKLYREKKLKENPNWDRERAKNYRLKHAENYNFIQARYFFRKLTPEQKKSLVDALEEKKD